jgi:hypothetical protein
VVAATDYRRCCWSSSLHRRAIPLTRPIKFLAGIIKIQEKFALNLRASQGRSCPSEEATMLKPPVTFDVDATANAQAKLVAREPRHLEMKWIATERGFEPSWYVCPSRQAHFILRRGQLVPAGA